MKPTKAIEFERNTTFDGLPLVYLPVLLNKSNTVTVSK